MVTNPSAGKPDSSREEHHGLHFKHSHTVSRPCGPGGETGIRACHRGPENGGAGNVFICAEISPEDSVQKADIRYEGKICRLAAQAFRYHPLMTLNDLRTKAVRRIADLQGRELTARVRREKLTYLDGAALHDLRDAVREADRQQRPGMLIECGCALGGSAIVMAASRAGNDRPLYVHDVFGMIPPPGEHDRLDVHDRYAAIAAGKSAGLDGDSYYGYRDDLASEVAESFFRFGMPPEASNIHLVRGLFQETLNPDGPVAVAHVDGDWYESVMTCLLRIWPTLVSGGVMVIDDYYAWSGCRDAVDEFTVSRQDCERVQRSRLHLVKR